MSRKRMTERKNKIIIPVMWGEWFAEHSEGEEGKNM